MAEKRSGNDVSLKEFLTHKIDSLEDRMETIFELHKVALEKSESQIMTRLDNMNEWRGQSRDQMATYATKSDLDAMCRELKGLINTMREIFVSKEEFLPIKSVVYGMTGIILVAVLGAIVALVVIR
jgi:uncharacterized protein YicC (UPF0701 family)